MVKKCKRKDCKNIITIPSWVYCSDECGNKTRREYEKKWRYNRTQKKLVVKS